MGPALAFIGAVGIFINEHRNSMQTTSVLRTVQTFVRTLQELN